MGVATPAALQIAIIPDAHRGRHETITLDAGSSAPLEHAFRATMKDLQYLDQLDTLNHGRIANGNSEAADLALLQAEGLIGMMPVRTSLSRLCCLTNHL